MKTWGEQIRLSVEIDKLSRKIARLRTLSPVGYPWAAKEIEKLEKELRSIETRAATE